MITLNRCAAYSIEKPFSLAWICTLPGVSVCSLKHMRRVSATLDDYHLCEIPQIYNSKCVDTKKNTEKSQVCTRQAVITVDCVCALRMLFSVCYFNRFMMQWRPQSEETNIFSQININIQTLFFNCISKKMSNCCPGLNLFGRQHWNKQWPYASVYKAFLNISA